jgi:uncharacterized protein YbjT (DUF2867 family)
MILVTGATGRTGDQVVRALRGLGLPVRALVRKGSEYYWLNDTGCGFFFGDLRDPSTLARACIDVEYLVVCSGLQVETRQNNHNNVTVAGHKALFDAARTRGIRRTVLISCMGVDRGHDVAAFNARKGAEDALIESGIEYSILRACAHEHLFLDLAWRIKNGDLSVLPGPGTNQLSPIATRDIALMAAASLDLQQVQNHTIEVGGPELMSARAAFELACDVVGVQPDARVLPSAALAVGRRLGRPLRRYANRLSELATWFSDDLWIAPEHSQGTFGFELTPLRAAMEASHQLRLEMSDPDMREKRQVHPQFYATVYEPGTAKLSEMPQGPRAPRG